MFLTRFASKVYLVHRRDTLRASKIMQDKAFANPKIKFEWDSEVIDVKDASCGVVTAAVVRNLKTGATRDVPIEGLFVCGEMLGGLFWSNYPGGTGLAAGMVFGRRAGTHA